MVELKDQVGVVSAWKAPGFPVINVFGGVALTVKLLVAGVASKLPAASTARTRNVWVPLSSALVWGLVQGMKSVSTPSYMHSNVVVTGSPPPVV